VARKFSAPNGLMTTLALLFYLLFLHLLFLGTDVGAR